MKCLLLMIFVIFAVTDAKWKTKTHEQYDLDRGECLEAEKFPPGQRKQIIKGKFPREPGCYYRCLGLHFGIWDDVNGFDNEKTYQMCQVDGWDLTVEGMQQCNTPENKEADPCKWSAKVAKCMWDRGLIRLINVPQD